MLFVVSIHEKCGGSAGRGGCFARNAILLGIVIRRGLGLGGFMICEITFNFVY